MSLNHNNVQFVHWPGLAVNMGSYFGVQSIRTNEEVCCCTSAIFKFNLDSLTGFRKGHTFLATLESIFRQGFQQSFEQFIAKDRVG